jgi:hypothetical protein
MKEIESLKNIAPYVYSPFLALAMVKDGFLQGANIDWSPIEENGSLRLVVCFVFSLIIVSLVSSGITWFVFRFATYGSDPRLTIETMPLPYVMSCLCIGFGVWGFAAYLFPGEVPKAPLNLFWHLGLLAYGFHLL